MSWVRIPPPAYTRGNRRGQEDSHPPSPLLLRCRCGCVSDSSYAPHPWACQSQHLLTFAPLPRVRGQPHKTAQHNQRQAQSDRPAHGTDLRPWRAGQRRRQGRGCRRRCMRGCRRRGQRGCGRRGRRGRRRRRRCRRRRCCGQQSRRSRRGLRRLERRRRSDRARSRRLLQGYGRKKAGHRWANTGFERVSGCQVVNHDAAHEDIVVVARD